MRKRKRKRRISEREIRKLEVELQLTSNRVISDSGSRGIDCSTHNTASGLSAVIHPKRLELLRDIIWIDQSWTITTNQPFQPHSTMYQYLP